MRYSKELLGLFVLLMMTACVSDGGSNTSNNNSDERSAQAALTYTKLGVDYMNKGDYALAEKRFERAIELAPRSSMVHWTYGVLQEKLKYNKKAEASFKKAIKLDRKSGDAQNAYGAFLCRQGRIKEATSAFDKAIANPLYRNILNANLNAADCFMQNERYAEAKPYITAALDINEESAKANFFLATVYFHEGRLSQSSVVRKRLSVEASDNPGVLWLCVMTERKLGNRSAEAVCTKNLLRRYPTSKEAESI